MAFKPITRLEKILFGEKVEPRTRLETSVKYAVDNAGGGSGSGLPAVTSDDNGKFLRVQNGDWDKVEYAPVAPFVISATFNAQTMAISNISTVFQSIVDAAKDNTPVFFVAQTPGAQDKIIISVPLTQLNTDAGYAEFSGAFHTDENTPAVAIIKLTDNDGVLEGQVNVYPFTVSGT